MVVSLSRVKSTLVSRNVTIAGHRTSVRLEPEMWTALQEIARREGSHLNALCTAVDERKGPDGSLTAAIRVFVMAYFRAAATDEGHRLAGHGTEPRPAPASRNGSAAPRPSA